MLFSKLQKLYSGEERDPDTSHKFPELSRLYELLLFHVQPHKFLEAQYGWHLNRMLHVLVCKQKFRVDS